MRLLLDTHALIWWDGEPERLFATAHGALEDPLNEVWMSVASAWELQIKLGTGKLRLRTTLEVLIRNQEANGFHLLPVTLGHVLTLGGLPPLHRDPFDRLLVAQARTEGAMLVSHDAALPPYGVPVLW